MSPVGDGAIVASGAFFVGGASASTVGAEAPPTEASAAGSYCARNFASSGSPSSIARRSLSTLTQASAIGRAGQRAEIDDHRCAFEQFRRARDAVAHFRAEAFDIERAHPQVGHADLTDLEIAGQFIVRGRRRAHAPVPVASGGRG